MTSGHTEKEGDESQVNFLSPSNINIQKSRRITYSVDPGNEGYQSSTSVPSEGEALGNVVDVDPISSPHYEPIYTTTVGLRISKRHKSEKKKLLNNQKYWFHSILRIRYNDNRHQREHSNNIGVEGDSQCPTSTFKR